MVQPENIPLSSVASESLEGLAPPKSPSPKGREFLGEFRELLRAELIGGERGLALEPARNVTHTVSKLARFLAEQHGVIYSPERESVACQALREGVLLTNPPPEALGSCLELVLRHGRAGAQAFVDRLSADASNSSKSITSTVSRLRAFLGAAEDAGWIEAVDTRLKNPRAVKLDWDEFLPMKHWRLRSQGEVSRGEKSRSHVLNQISIIHTFMEDVLGRFGLPFDPEQERKTIDRLREDGHPPSDESVSPRSLVEALLTHGDTLVQDFVAASSNDGRPAALRSFYSELRNMLPGAFPDTLVTALKLPAFNPNARLPFFERFIEESYSGASTRVARKDLRVFGHFVASRHGLTVIESDEKIEWRLSPEGKLMFAGWGQIGPVTEAIRGGARDELVSFRDHLKTRHDLRPEYQRDLFNAAKRFLLWATEGRLVDEKPESLRGLTFDIREAGEGASVPLRVKKTARKENRGDEVQSRSTAGSPEEKRSARLSSEPIHRATVLADQARLIRTLLENPPTAVALGDLFMTHTRDYDSPREAITTRTAQHSAFSTIDPELARALDTHLERLQRSPFNRTGGKKYEGPIFIDGRGGGVLSCNVPELSQVIDLSRVQLGLNVAHAIYRDTRNQLGGTVTLWDVLRLDLDDVKPGRTAVTFRGPEGDVIGGAVLSSVTGAQLRTYIEIIRASELGSLWASFNSQKHLFMAPDGYPLLDFLSNGSDS